MYTVAHATRADLLEKLVGTDARAGTFPAGKVRQVLPDAGQPGRRPFQKTAGFFRRL